MGLFGKKKKEESMLPDLPESNATLPNINDYNSEPVMANSPPTEGQNNSNLTPQGNAIKNEIYNPASSGLGAPGEMQKSSFEPLPNPAGEDPRKIVAEPVHAMEAHPQNNEPVNLPTGNSPGLKPAFSKPMETVSPPVRGGKSSTQPVYIRLDKFKAGLESFEEIKTKVSEIEDLLSKIRSIKDKEERELEEWEREIQIVKARIDQIDSEVFRDIN